MTPGKPFCVNDIISFQGRRQLEQRAALRLFVFFLLLDIFNGLYEDKDN